MKKTVFLFLLMASCLMANAVVVQKVMLKNGSVLNGFIERQTFDGKYTVHTDNAIICITGGKATVSGEMQYGEKDLDKAWVEWAEKNDEFIGSAPNRTLMLGNVIVDGRTVAAKVKILESGENVKYLEMTPATHSVDWKDVKEIRGDKRSKLTLSGINRIYTLKNGSKYEGQYALETDSTLSLYLSNGGMRTFKLADVVKYTFVPLNPNQTVFEQSPVVDVIKLQNEALYRGVIIEQNYFSEKDTENYVLVHEQGGSIQSIKMSDISEFSKEENKAYRVLSDILLKAGELVVNRIPAKTVGVKERNGILLLDSIALAPVVNAADGGKATEFVVECNLGNAQSMDIYQLVKVEKRTVKKTTEYFFSYKNLVDSAIRPQSVEKSVNNTTRAEYQVYTDGIYALYNAKEKKAFTITVKK